jgi:plastocyanin
MLGLPLHPLVVHLAVVLVPLASIAVLLISWREVWRQRYAGAAAALALGAALVAVVAAQSGSELKSDVLRASAEAGVRARFGQHPDYGRATEIAALALATGAAVVWATTKPRLRSRVPHLACRATYVAVALPAAVALVAVGLAGHSGAALVWRDLGTYPPGKLAVLNERGSAPAPAPTPDVPAGAIVVRMLEFRFEPNEIEVGSGAEVVLHAVNNGNVFHTFTVLNPRADTHPLWPGTSATLSFTAPLQTGTYRFLCTEEGHEDEGMVGQIIVR